VEGQSQESRRFVLLVESARSLQKTCPQVGIAQTSRRSFIVTTKLKFALAIITIVNASLIAAVSAAHVVLPDDKKPAEKPAAAPLEGGYAIVSGEKDGKTIPPEHLKGSAVLFTADRIVGTDKDKKELFTASYTLDTTRTPWVIKMKSTTPMESEAVGLIKKDGDTVTIVYALPGADAPTEFRTRDKQHLFVLKSLLKPSPTKP
jgi:uncharacterized protein (TIGR03067 family)